jgi:transcriptional regulator with GAF, ATPase, and Fis domain
MDSHFSPIKWNPIAIPEHISQIWQNIINLLAKIINVPAALIMRVHYPTIEVFLTSNSRENPYEKGEEAELPGLYCNYVMRNQKKLLIPDARKDPVWDHNPDIKLGMVSYLGLPLKWSNGDIFGTICVLDSKENAYSEIYQDLLQEFQHMIEGHLELIILNQELNAKNQKLEFAQSEINQLKKLLPICINCKKIRDDNGYWTEIDHYFRQHSDINFSHGYCNECFAKIYPEYADRILKEIEEEKKKE